MSTSSTTPAWSRVYAEGGRPGTAGARGIRSARRAGRRARRIVAVHRAAVEERQTRCAQNALPARACGFESHPPHHLHQVVGATAPTRERAFSLSVQPGAEASPRAGRRFGSCGRPRRWRRAMTAASRSCCPRCRGLPAARRPDGIAPRPARFAAAWPHPPRQAGPSEEASDEARACADRRSGRALRPDRRGVVRREADAQARRGAQDQ